MLRIAVIGVVLLLLPVSAEEKFNPDESTPTNLYFHIWDTFSKFVINTQAYNATAFETGGINFPTTDGTPLAPYTGPWDFNTIYGYSTAGPVEYEFSEAGLPRLHPERGIAADVEIDDEYDTNVYLYIDARSLFGGSESPAFVPKMTFSATVRTGDNEGDTAALDAGELLIDGAITANLFDARMCPAEATGIPPALVSQCRAVGPVDPAWVEPPQELYDNMPAEDEEGNPFLYPDSDSIIEVVIPMGNIADKIPADEAYNIRLDWFQEPPALTSGPDQFAMGNLRIALDNQHQPRLSMSITNPVYVSFLHPQVSAGTLLIHSGVNSPWGTYDVDLDNITIKINGDANPPYLKKVASGKTHIHGEHQNDAEVTWLWDFREDNAELGVYDIELIVQNRGKTATARATDSFEIKEQGIVIQDSEGETQTIPIEENNESPAPFGLLALGLLALVRRRS